MLRHTLQAASVLDNPMQPLSPKDYPLPYLFPVEEPFPPTSYDLSKPRSFLGQRFLFLLLGCLPLWWASVGPEDPLYEQLQAFQHNAAAKILMRSALLGGLIFLLRDLVSEPARYRSIFDSMLIRWAMLLLWLGVLVIKISFPKVGVCVGIVLTLVFMLLFRWHFLDVATAGLWSPETVRQFLSNRVRPAGIEPAEPWDALMAAWRSWDTYNDRELKNPMLVQSPAGTRWLRVVLASYTCFFLAHAVSHYVWQAALLSDFQAFASGYAPLAIAGLLLIPSLACAGLMLVILAVLSTAALLEDGATALAMQQQAFAPERYEEFLWSMPWSDQEI